MTYSHEVEKMCPVAQGVNHGGTPIPVEVKWVKATEIEDISGCTHGVGGWGLKQAAWQRSEN